MVIDRTKLIGNIFEGLNLEENNYYNVILRDAIVNNYEDKYLGKLIKTYRVKNNEKIALPSIERKIIKSFLNDNYDRYFIFSKWIDESLNEFTANDLVNSDKSLTVKYNYIYVPLVANIQVINGEQTMMNSFTIHSSFLIYMDSEYNIENYKIKIQVINSEYESDGEYKNTINFTIEDLDDFEGNILELSDAIYLYLDSKKNNQYEDLLIDLKLNIYRSDASTGD